MYLFLYCIYHVFIEQIHLFFVAIHAKIIQMYKFFLLNVNFIVFIHWMLTLYMYSLKLYLLMS